MLLKVGNVLIRDEHIQAVKRDADDDNMLLLTWISGGIPSYFIGPEADALEAYLAAEAIDVMAAMPPTAERLAAGAELLEAAEAVWASDPKRNDDWTRVSCDTLDALKRAIVQMRATIRKGETDA